MKGCSMADANVGIEVVGWAGAAVLITRELFAYAWRTGAARITNGKGSNGFITPKDCEKTHALEAKDHESTRERLEHVKDRGSSTRRKVESLEETVGRAFEKLTDKLADQNQHLAVRIGSLHTRVAVLEETSDIKSAREQTIDERD